MPSARQTLKRYRIINACITNPKKPFPTLLDLQRAMAREDIQVEKRAIEGDLEAMRFDTRLGYHAPIEYNRKHRGYYYTDPDYNFDKLPLTTEELDTFEVIVESLKRFREAEIVNHVAGVFDKLDKVVVKQLQSKQSTVTHPVVDFEKMPYSKGIEHFDKVYQAILKQHALLITYQPFDKPAHEYTFHPYLLKEYKLRWYVLGYSEKRKANGMLALDRIENLTSKKTKFRKYRGTNIENYFKHTLGITIDKTDVKEIRLWFSVAQGHYIKTQHLHDTQKTISDDHTGLVIRLQLIPNYELLQTLLSFGPEVKVLEPRSLQTQLKERVKQMLALYEK
ncbi:MAG: WYL domain-containing protein [Chryseolinea sp.]